MVWKLIGIEIYFIIYEGQRLCKNMILASWSHVYFFLLNPLIAILELYPSVQVADG